MHNKFVWSTIFAFVALSAFAIYLTKDAYKLLPRFPTSDELVSHPHENWLSFSPTSKLFTALFPIMPQYASDSVKDTTTKQVRKYDMYVAETNDGTIFMITMITFPTTPSREDAIPLMKSLIQDMAKTGGRNQLKNLQDALYQGLPAVNFLIDNESAGLRVQGRSVMQDQYLFLQSVVGSSASQNAADVAYFLSAFQLTPTPLSLQIPFPPQT